MFGLPPQSRQSLRPRHRHLLHLRPVPRHEEQGRLMSSPNHHTWCTSRTPCPYRYRPRTRTCHRNCAGTAARLCPGPCTNYRFVASDPPHSQRAVQEVDGQIGYPGHAGQGPLGPRAHRLPRRLRASSIAQLELGGSGTSGVGHRGAWPQSEHPPHRGQQVSFTGPGNPHCAGPRGPSSRSA